MATGATSAVKNLEMHHVAGLTDVRSRIARADAAIARLIADTKATSDAIKGIQQQQQDHQNRVLEKLQSLENKVITVIVNLFSNPLTSGAYKWSDIYGKILTKTVLQQMFVWKSLLLLSSTISL